MKPHSLVMKLIISGLSLVMKLQPFKMLQSSRLSLQAYFFIARMAFMAGAAAAAFMARMDLIAAFFFMTRMAFMAGAAAAAFMARMDLMAAFFFMTRMAFIAGAAAAAFMER